MISLKYAICSNNTNKLSPQEQWFIVDDWGGVQIIQINLVLKNCVSLNEN